MVAAHLSYYTPYKYLSFDVGVLFLDAFNFAMFLALFDDFHRVDPTGVLLADQDDLGVVPNTELAEHVEILKTDQLSIGLHQVVFYIIF
jgi:hypothetical protein